MSVAPQIRLMCEGDIPALIGVLSRAYTSPQRFESRLRSYLRGRRAAPFVALIDDEPVGMVVGNDYGAFAYVSQMAVDPYIQRRGIGLQLMHRLSAWLDERRFQATELDATAPGAPLYRRFSFVDAGETVVYTSPRQPLNLKLTSWNSDAVVSSFDDATDRRSIFAADVIAFSGDRSEVLAALLDDRVNATFVVRRAGSAIGYAVAQPVAQRIGPIVANTPHDAALLIDATRGLFEGVHQVSVPADNIHIQTLLHDRGYQVERSLTHMLRGSRLQPRDRIYARINLGQG